MLSLSCRCSIAGTPMRRQSTQSILPAEKSGNENSSSDGKISTAKQILTRLIESTDVIDCGRLFGLKLRFLITIVVKGKVSRRRMHFVRGFTDKVHSED